MLKVITWFKRKPGMEVAEFQSYWRQQHPLAVLALPGLRKYVQNHPTERHYRGGSEPMADGVAETWWDDLDTVRAQVGTQELDDLYADEARFLDPDRRGQILAEEVTINPLGIPVDGIKQIVFVNRRSDLTPEQAQSHWRDVHGPLAVAAPGVGRYVQNHTLASQYRPGRPDPAYDGATMVWFADVDTARTAGASPEMAEVVADQPLFLDDSNIEMVTCREHHII